MVPRMGNDSARRPAIVRGAVPDRGPAAGSVFKPSSDGLATAQRPRHVMGLSGLHSSRVHTQCFGLNENRTGSPCPMYGGGPVLANACTALAAITMRNTRGAR